MSRSVAERRLISALAAHQSWANTTDRAARTAPARRALEERFLKEADGDAERAENLRRAYYARLSLLSAQARRARRIGAGASEPPTTAAAENP